MNAGARTLAAVAMIVAGSAQAQSGLADPTRPPNAAAAPQGGDEQAAGGKQLQSVLLSGGRKLAVIDGNVVPLGGTFGDARVVRITETEVVLKTGEETETLKLYPGVDKQAVKRGTRGARASGPVRGSATQGGAK
jgi:MSHA biogenesis protein MshK